MYYVLRDGTEVTIDQIREAFARGQTMLVHHNADNHTGTSLMLDGQEFDSRGECESVWEELWTTTPKSINQCCSAARC